MFIFSTLTEKIMGILFAFKKGLILEIFKIMLLNF